MLTAELLFFGRFYGGRARRVRQLLREFRRPRTVFVTPFVVGLDPALVTRIGHEMGFVAQGYDRISHPPLLSLAFTPVPPTGSRNGAGRP